MYHVPKLLTHLSEYNKHKRDIDQISAIVLSPHLHFYSESISKGETKYKFGQPIRTKKNRNLLLDHLTFGSIAAVASGNMFVAREFKNVDGGCFIKAMNGRLFSFRLLQFRLSAPYSLDPAHT